MCMYVSMKNKRVDWRSSIIVLNLFLGVFKKMSPRCYRAHSYTMYVNAICCFDLSLRFCHLIFSPLNTIHCGHVCIPVRRHLGHNLMAPSSCTVQKCHSCFNYSPCHWCLGCFQMLININKCCDEHFPSSIFSHYVVISWSSKKWDCWVKQLLKTFKADLWKDGVHCTRPGWVPRSPMVAPGPRMWSHGPWC